MCLLDTVITKEIIQRFIVTSSKLLNLYLSFHVNIKSVNQCDIWIHLLVIYLHERISLA